VTGNSEGFASSLEPRLVGDVAGEFVVRNYQRGYRWGREEVTRLLDDIHENRRQAYYLQPVVVKRMADDRWELVDGQQRLTTLLLILRYVQTYLPVAELSYSLTYETRPDSARFLLNPTVEESQHNIDFFHIFEAHRCIRKWFESRKNATLAALNFYKALTESVYVIWYEAPADVDSTELFARLNVGRIPLTDAELVKALILSRSRAGPGATNRALEIAAHWDSIENSLRASEVWAFAAGRVEDEPTHISLLLDAIAGGPTGRERPLFHTFETFRRRIEAEPDKVKAEPDTVKAESDRVKAVWQDVVDLHSLVLGWYDDRNLFHKIGYLIATSEPSERAAEFGGLVGLSRGRTKSRFEVLLDERIRDRIALSESGVLDLTYQRSKSLPVLLLMNVETVRRSADSAQRFSFSAHATRRWSLEHIHAQNAEQLTTAEQWTEWLRQHRRALSSLEIEERVREAITARIDAALADVTQDAFRRVQRDVTDLFSRTDGLDDGNVDSVANLALLDSGTNSALSNSVFEVKRRMIIERDRRGAYIPVCTRNVFLKYYTESAAQQLHYWGPEDREDYVRALVETIRPYLQPGGSAE